MNEAPEKIQLGFVENENHSLKIRGISYLEETQDGLIKYIRTDAFIERALKWYCLDCECNDNCKSTKCFFYREFERYLNGDEHAIPPKISNSILDEDGFISDNWRYRHFTKKIQDAFIEKACEWLQGFMECSSLFEYEVSESEKKKVIEDFKKYMKGE